MTLDNEARRAAAVAERLMARLSSALRIDRAVRWLDRTMTERGDHMTHFPPTLGARRARLVLCLRGWLNGRG